MIGELIGEALIAAIMRCRLHSSERAQAAWQWLQRAAVAPPGLELVAADGAKYTGLVVIERSRAVLLIALHHPPQPPASRPRAAEVDWGNQVRHPSLFEEDSVRDERNPLYRR